jgi:hydrogenase-4 component H
MVWRNVGHAARTRRLDDMPSRPDGFRGMIEHDALLCTGCGTCAYVCAPRAITLDTTGEAEATWKFAASQCSFCGLCDQYCPTHAITNPGKLPPVTGDRSRQHVAHALPSRPCAHCGRPTVPLPREVLQQLYDGVVTDATVAEQALCEACRRKAASRHLRDAFIRPAGAPDRTGAKP